MRRELVALESWPAAAVALAGGEPVALAYAFVETEGLWDVSVETEAPLGQWIALVYSVHRWRSLYRNRIVLGLPKPRRSLLVSLYQISLPFLPRLQGALTDSQ